MIVKIERLVLEGRNLTPEEARRIARKVGREIGEKMAGNKEMEGQRVVRISSYKHEGSE